MSSYIPAALICKKLTENFANTTIIKIDALTLIYLHLAQFQPKGLFLAEIRILKKYVEDFLYTYIFFLYLA